jgi:hypothetical protein
MSNMNAFANVPHPTFGIGKLGTKIAPSFARLTRTAPLHVQREKHVQTSAEKLRQQGAYLRT